MFKLTPPAVDSRGAPLAQTAKIFAAERHGCPLPHFMTRTSPGHDASWNSMLIEVPDGACLRSEWAFWAMRHAPPGTAAPRQIKIPAVIA